MSQGLPYFDESNEYSGIEFEVDDSLDQRIIEDVEHGKEEVRNEIIPKTMEIEMEYKTDYSTIEKTMEIGMENGIYDSLVVQKTTDGNSMIEETIEIEPITQNIINLKPSGMVEKEIDKDSLSYALKESFKDLCEAVSELKQLNLDSQFRLIVETDSVYDTSQRFIMYCRNDKENDKIMYTENKLYYDFNHGFSIFKKKADSLADFVLGEDDIFIFVHKFFKVFNDFNDCYLESDEDIEKPEYIKIDITEGNIESSLILEPINKEDIETFKQGPINGLYVIVENEIFFIKPFIILYLFKFFNLSIQEYIDDIYYINTNDKEELSEYLKNDDIDECEEYYNNIINFINDNELSDFINIKPFIINRHHIDKYIEDDDLLVIKKKHIEQPRILPINSDFQQYQKETKNKRVRIINNLYY